MFSGVNSYSPDTKVPIAERQKNFSSNQFGSFKIEP
jgi:hypothetical protein